MKYLHLLSIGANAILLALFAWLYVLTKDPGMSAVDGLRRVHGGAVHAGAAEG